MYETVFKISAKKLKNKKLSLRSKVLICNAVLSCRGIKRKSSEANVSINKKLKL